MPGSPGTTCVKELGPPPEADHQFGVTMSKTRRRGPQLEVSGTLCLAFANTANARHDPRQMPLDDYADLVDWGRQTRILKPAEARRLEQTAAERGDAADAVFAEAVVARGAVQRIFGAVAAGQQPAAEDVAKLNEALPHVEVVHGAGGYRWGFSQVEELLAEPLRGVLFSAAQLLISDESRWVRQCPGTDCGLLFLNHSHSHRRKWCAMKRCGERPKARRHYYKHKKPRREERKAKREQELWERHRAQLLTKE